MSGKPCSGHVDPNVRELLAASDSGLLFPLNNLAWIGIATPAAGLPY
jgi:hypothetical protein